MSGRRREYRDVHGSGDYPGSSICGGPWVPASARHGEVEGGMHPLVQKVVRHYGAHEQAQSGPELHRYTDLPSRDLRVALSAGSPEQQTRSLAAAITLASAHYAAPLPGGS
ncbi:hypothetical protein CONLIGDRAFT_690950 [Coniochaeta ligniaria NRRL 30616]|uniref:Uncharacterized protein n=1 Tax=Coniochaeta ligniaria NRRL 30616 TaxID=1408157 RepID=A0A1J7ID14_9PEZI|nr:hypothetical protein CONLIGDRAFT_690950 [Coniochaeta ligniaria NRRL 30616]